MDKLSKELASTTAKDGGLKGRQCTRHLNGNVAQIMESLTRIEQNQAQMQAEISWLRQRHEQRNDEMMSQMR